MFLITQFNLTFDGSTAVDVEMYKRFPLHQSAVRPATAENIKTASVFDSF